MTIEVLDPSYDEDGEPFTASQRLDSLTGIVVGVISNGKQGTGRFFDAFAEHLQTAHGVTRVERLVKANYSAPAGDDIMDATKTWNALVSGIGD